MSSLLLLQRLLLTLVTVVAVSTAVAATQRVVQAYAEGSDAYARGEFGAAERAFREVVALAPELSEGYLNLGVALEGQGAHDAAKDVYRDAVRRFPGDVAPLNHLCTALIHDYSLRGERGAALEAQKTCMDAVRVKRSDVTALRNLGTVYTHLFRFEEAIPYLQSALDLSTPGNSDLQLTLAQALGCANRTEEALVIARRVVGERPDDAKAYCGLGSILKLAWPQNNEPEEALRACVRLSARMRGRQAVMGWLHAAELMLQVRVLETGGAAYGVDEVKTFPPERAWYGRARFRFDEKAVVRVDFPHSVFVEGPSGLVYDDAFVYTGSHAYHARVDAEFRGAGRTVRTLARAVSLLSLGLDRYFHFAAEFLPRLALAKEHGLLDDEEVTLIVPDHRLVDEALELFGVRGSTRVLRWAGRQGERLAVEALTVLDWPHETDDDVWDAFRAPRRGLRLVRERVAAECGDDAATGRKTVVVVSREDADVRRLADEDVLVARLRRMFADSAWDVEVFRRGGSKSLVEQARVFRRASLIVSGHGSGLANAMFARAGTPVLYFPLDPPADASLAHVAVALQLDLWVVPDVSCSFFGRYEVPDFHLVADAVELLTGGATSGGGGGGGGGEEDKGGGVGAHEGL